MAATSPATARSPESDISPTAPNPSKPSPPSENGKQKDSHEREYFPPLDAGTGEKPVVSTAGGGTSNGKAKAVVISPGSDASPGTDSADSEVFGISGRKSSVSSLVFRQPRNPSLPQGESKRTDGNRIRAASPPHKRFHAHVSFDNVKVGEATKNNPASYTLNSSHSGYQRNKRSRTFMVGVDEHSYSDYALEWLLNELVEDGDHIVCVTVIEKEVRSLSEAYKAEARAKLEAIKAKSGPSRAIAITLEYAVGKLHTTFQTFIQLHQPSMLIVGTKGRSLGSFQGIMGSRNSFSKYCLQYCPIPVVVVRPSEKREKKKAKRQHDEDRQTYAKMLPGGIHEADSETSSTFDLEVKLPQDQEAHEVARVLGLPAAFDPTLKPINPRELLQPRHHSAPSVMEQTTTEAADAAAAAASSSPTAKMATTDDTDSGDESPDQEDDEDEMPEFETFVGREALEADKKKDKLHRMEVGEAAALLKHRDEPEDDE